MILTPATTYRTPLFTHTMSRTNPIQTSIVFYQYYSHSDAAQPNLDHKNNNQTLESTTKLPSNEPQSTSSDISAHAPAAQTITANRPPRSHHNI